MAALVAGVQYGLSSHSDFHENKSLIFVKLTDSSQRAIEDFLKNRNKTSQNPTIQFSGNEGQLSFPSSQSSHGAACFTFALSGNQDMEGPQGSFECVQQAGHRSLQNLGALPCKMRIQANDDVYETTKHRMAAVDQNNKNKCTRVIKASGPDIGRKVKVKSTGRTIPPPPVNSRHREPTSIPTPNMSQSSRLMSSSNMSRSHPTSHVSSNSTSSPSYKPISNNNPPARHQPEKKNNDLCRRPLRERLVHVLALRPYKKPELYDRLNREGLKDRERSAITSILKQITSMKDNAYVLQRHVWNDVQEDWPFYTEQDKATLKRRKPQNLTPPGSSDCSSGSGTSPNSTHPGSPPTIIAPPPSLKRPGYHEGNDGITTKRMRISHYKKFGDAPSAPKSSTMAPEPGKPDNNMERHQRNDNRPEIPSESINLFNNAPTKTAPKKKPATPTNDIDDLVNIRYNQEPSSVASRNVLNTCNYNSDDYKSPSPTDRVSPVRRERDDISRNVKDRERKQRNSREQREVQSPDSPVRISCPDLDGGAGNPGLALSSRIDESEETPDWKMIYPPIRTAEERIRYKAIWREEHPLYVEMYAQMAKDIKLIHCLHARKEQAKREGNMELSHEISLQIRSTYYNVRGGHAESRKKYDTLHGKLAQIKSMIEEWDSNHLQALEATSNSTIDNGLGN